VRFASLVKALLDTPSDRHGTAFWALSAGRACLALAWLLNLVRLHHWMGGSVVEDGLRFLVPHASDFGSSLMRIDKADVDLWFTNQFLSVV